MLQDPKLNAHHEPRVAGEGPSHWDPGWLCVCSVLVGGWQGGPGRVFTGTWMGALKDRGLVILEDSSAPCQGVLMPTKGGSPRLI